MGEIRYAVEPDLSDALLNELFESAWPDHQYRTFAKVLEHSLTHIGAFDADRLVGFVYVAWDGESHGFVLNPTVHGSRQREGIGEGMMRRAAQIAGDRGLEWLHVDFVGELRNFYRRCGYRHTDAGLLNVRRLGH